MIHKSYEEDSVIIRLSNHLLILLSNHGCKLWYVRDLKRSICDVAPVLARPLLVIHLPRRSFSQKLSIKVPDSATLFSIISSRVSCLMSLSLTYLLSSSRSEISMYTCFWLLTLMGRCTFALDVLSITAPWISFRSASVECALMTWISKKTPRAVAFRNVHRYLVQSSTSTLFNVSRRSDPIIQSRQKSYDMFSCSTLHALSYPRTWNWWGTSW